MKATYHVFKNSSADQNADWSERWAAGRPLSPCETELPSAPELGCRGVPDALPEVCATGEGGHCLCRGRAGRGLSELTSHACCVCHRPPSSCFSGGGPATRHPARRSAGELGKAPLPLLGCSGNGMPAAVRRVEGQSPLLLRELVTSPLVESNTLPP